MSMATSETTLHDPVGAAPAPSAPRIQHVISIGAACFCAQAIADAGLRRYSTPFDWIFAGTGLTRAILLDDFANFLDRGDYINVGSPKAWTLPRYRKLFGSGIIINHHDIGNDAEFGALVRAVARMRRVLASRDSKLFVHLSSDESLGHPHYGELIDTLRAMTPNAHFLTVGFTAPGEQAALSLAATTPDSRRFTFTPTSELVEGLRFAAPSDNLILRGMFEGYDFDLDGVDTQATMAMPAGSAPAATGSAATMRLLSSEPACTLDIRVASDLLHSVELEEISPSSHADRPDPDFLYGECPPERLQHFRNDQYIPPVRVSRIRQALVTGPFFMTGALVQAGGACLDIPDIASHPQSDASQQRLAEMRRRLASGEANIRRLDGEVLLLACNGHQIYGHWLVDFLPKLAMLPEAGLSLDTIRVLLPDNMGTFGAALLSLVGIRSEQVITHSPEREVLHVESLVVPSTLRWGGRCVPDFTRAVSFLNGRIALDRSSQGAWPQRIFLSRSMGGQQHGRRLIGEAELVEQAEKFGFKALAPETLPLHEQVGLLQQATHIIGPYGSGLHGSIFNTAGVKVCGFHGPTAFDALQSGIGERLSQPTGYIFGRPTPTAEDHNANTVDPAVLDRFLTEQAV